MAVWSLSEASMSAVMPHYETFELVEKRIQGVRRQDSMGRMCQQKRH